MSILIVPQKSGRKVLVRSLATSLELRAYTSWTAMRNRCARKDPGFADLKYYAAKGITVCEQWKDDFTVFLSDMGLPPTEKHTLERKKGELGYSQENCCWATAQEQAINRDSTLWIEADGVRKYLTEWAESSGVNAATISRRYKRGYRDAASLFFKGELPKKGKRDLTINGRTQSIAGWAREAGCTAPCLFYRISLGLTGEDILRPPPARLPNRKPGVKMGRPFGAKNKPKDLPLDTRAPNGANPPHANPLGEGRDGDGSQVGQKERAVNGA